MAHIVHVTETLATGVLAVISTLIEQQLADGHRVSLIGSSVRPDTNPDFRKKIPPAAQYIELPMQKEIGLRDLGDAIKLRRLLRSLNPDAIHLHSSKAGAIGRLASISMGCTTVYQPHGFAFLRRDVSDLKRHFYGFLEFLLGIFPSKIAACSAGEAAAAAKYLKWRTIDVIPNGIKFPDFAPRASTGSHKIVVGTCGRICPQKDPFFFAKVAQLCGVEFEFRWIGAGDYPDGEQALKAANVNCLGWRSNGDVPYELAQLDIYIQTSAWEGMPISVIEAMSAGLPVVVTDVAGNRDLVQSVAPDCVVRTPADMADQVRRLSLDSELRSRYGEALRRDARDKYGAERMCRRYESLYGVKAPRLAFERV